MPSIIPPLKNLIFTLFLYVLRSSSLIPDIVESPTMATAPFGHFTSVTLLLIWAELIHSFDLFLCDRSVWSAYFSYALRFKKFLFFLSNFLQLYLQLFVVNCFFISAIIFFYCCHCSCFYSYCCWCCYCHCCLCYYYFYYYYCCWCYHWFGLV